MVPPDFAAAGLAGSLDDHTAENVRRRGAARRSGALVIAGVLGVLGLTSIGFGVVRATTDVVRPGLPAGEAVATVEFQGIPHTDAVGVWYPTQVAFSTADHRREVTYVTAREQLGAQYPTAPTVVTISYDVRHPTNAKLLYVGVSFLQSRSMAGPTVLAVILWVLGGLLLFAVLRRPAIFDP